VEIEPSVTLERKRDRERERKRAVERGGTGELSTGTITFTVIFNATLELGARIKKWAHEALSA